MTDLEPYDVYAIRYGRNANQARDNFIFDPLHDGPMPLDYFIWLITGNGRTVVVDLGFEHAGAARRGRELTRLPSEGLAMLGVDARRVDDVVVTHLHYDHAGELGAFPNATLHVQEAEMAYATGRHMTQARLRLAFDVDYVCAFVRAVYDERVAFVDGDRALAPGISLHHIGGHTAGHQAVRVWTKAGWLVLASDAVHLYANMEEQNPFPIVHNVSDMVAGYDRLRDLADRPELVVPGHDPLVIERFPAPDPKLQGEIVRLSDGPQRW